MNKYEYIKDVSTGIEVVSMENVKTSFPPHTHTGHYVFGIVTEGCIDIRIGEEVRQCKEGEYFSIYPDVCHSINPVSQTYSLVTTCIPGKSDISRELDIIKNAIIGNPEMELSIADMSQRVNISSYHLIRKFSSENGLTPHKFQMQCRIRKAQELLREGYRVIEVAQMVGFCDQSHMDRVFRKQLGISPEEYIKSAILSKAD
ncbi:MAG: AraC family transcriptional regulator [Lachnospiraceae bacterium]|nr:AraC family transcriptional regulator [Lachnospiraceae bacterium]